MGVLDNCIYIYNEVDEVCIWTNTVGKMEA